MIESLKYYIAESFDPFENLAIEETLLLNTEESECILFLWQNVQTVVIGKNQNAWQECKIKELEKDGGHLVRRLSGGGAVFHDMGNLNFTFLVRKKNYDIEKQLSVIVKALEKFGITAVKSGRNDIEVDGKKFSGNAFYNAGDFCYHHGTILVNVDFAMLAKYLKVSLEKLSSKGIKSVKSRVINLVELKLSLTIDNLKAALIDTFQEVYGLKASYIKKTDLKSDFKEKSKEKFASNEWRFGNNVKFSIEINKYFLWGSIMMGFEVVGGKIKEVACYSDAMETNFISDIPKILEGIVFSSENIIDKIMSLADEPIKQDIIDFIKEQDF